MKETTEKDRKPTFRIPVQRVIEKLDSYLDRKEYAEAERHLKYWLEEAEAGGDLQGKLTVLNEMIGYYRKQGRQEEGMEAIRGALVLAEQLEIEKTPSFATTLLNAATGYKAFGMAEQAMPLYRKARDIYENTLDENDSRLGGLFNNMALALTDLGEFREARECYEKAIRVMRGQEHGEPEIAISYCNLADLTATEKGLEAGEAEISGYLTEAEKLLNTQKLPRNGYYAYVCEKCAPVFGYYGFFLTEQRLMERAKEIYERA